MSDLVDAYTMGLWWMLVAVEEVHSKASYMAASSSANNDANVAPGR